MDRKIQENQKPYYFSFLYAINLHVFNYVPFLPLKLLIEIVLLTKVKTISVLNK